MPVPVRQSSSSAWPARDSSAAIWSMIPLGTPTKSFSARRARAASSGRGTGTWWSSVRARAVAHSSAADEDRPAPAGRSASIAISAPPYLVTRLAERPGHPGRVGGPAGHRSGLEGVDVHDDGPGFLLSGDQGDAPVFSAGRRGGDPGAQGEGQHEALGVVRAAHQVDPAGREPDAVRLAAVCFGEPGGGIRRPGRGHADRHWAAACRGSTGSKNTPAPSSAAARCRRTPGARRAGARCAWR